MLSDYYICVNSKTQTQRNRIEYWLPEAWGGRREGNVGQRVQTSSCKVIKSSKDRMHSTVIIFNDTVLHPLKLLREGLLHVLTAKKKWSFRTWCRWHTLPNAVLVSIFAIYKWSSQRVIHLKLTQCCMSVYLSKGGKETVECIRTSTWFCQTGELDAGKKWCGIGPEKQRALKADREQPSILKLN